MIILPAIDIKDGRCVRLTQGDFDTVEKVAEDWFTTALSFAKDGAEWIHMVDLDGVLTGRPENSHMFIEVAKKTGLKVELGGGIRSMKDISHYLEKGISRIILGTAAINEQELVEEAVNEYGDRIAVGIDAKDRRVRGSGWLKNSGIDFIDLAKAMENIGVQTMIFTDISKDGTLKGPNLAQLKELSAAVSVNIIASGGIHSLADIKALSDMGLYGAICGKAIYKGELSLKEAINHGKAHRRGGEKWD
jgi:phosphoribosylformimino-5-aminoimidazole carboxamide ribotide isomerase